MTWRHQSQLALVLFVFSLSCIIGCSSLPKRPVNDSELDFRADSFQKLGNKKFNAGQYHDATVYFQQALAVHASVDNRSGVSQSLSNIGRVQLALELIESAENFFHRALKSSEGLQKPHLTAQALGGLSAVELQRGAPLISMGFLEEALALPLLNPGLERAVLLHDQGVAYQKLSNPEASEIAFQQALNMHESLQDPLGIASDCFSLAKLNESRGHIDKALKLANRALANDKKVENPPGIAQDLTLLGSLASQKALPEQAIDYYQRAQLAWQAIGQPEKAAKVNSQLENLAPDKK